jgi:hypothetical protein
MREGDEKGTTHDPFSFYQLIVTSSELTPFWGDASIILRSVDVIK